MGWNKWIHSITFENCAPLTDCISEINNTQIDNVKDLDNVMQIYNSIEYSDNYAKTSGSLWQYCRNEPDGNNITNIQSFKFKSRFSNNTGIAGTIGYIFLYIYIEIVVQLKYLSNFWRTL